MPALLPTPDMMHFLRLAQLAGREIMAVYASDFAVASKADLTPVTEADALAEKVILKGLQALWPDIPVVAEEATAAGHRPDVGECFLLVDPLDGTKEFTSRNGEFTVNICRVEKGEPVAGVVYAPAIQQAYWGEQGVGAAYARLAPQDSLVGVDWQLITVRKPAADGLTVLASRSHMDKATADYLETIPVKSLTSAGSSLKFCLIAKGEADLYPRLGRTMEWDTAAGQAVLEAAGGKVCCLNGERLMYGKKERGFDNPAFVATG